MPRPSRRARLAIPLLLWLAAAVATPCAAQPEERPEAPAPAARGVPFRDEPALSSATLWRVAVATAGGLLLVWLAASALRRYGFSALSPPAEPRRIRVLETRRLSPRATLVLIRLDEREILMGHAGDRLVVLSQGDAPPVAEAERRG